MLEAFGEQHWWPADSQLEVIIGAILTQQTSWKNVEKTITNLKKLGGINKEFFKNIDTQKLEEIIKPSGFYRIKAKRLKNFFSDLEKYNLDLKQISEIDKMTLRKELLKINGIGKETADSIILYALNKDIFVIDAYTKRFFSRFGAQNEKDYENLREIFEESLKTASINNTIHAFKEMHALIVELGKNFCKKEPLCIKCPLVSICDRRGVENECSWN
jgi:endonuclease-3 related protein